MTRQAKRPIPRCRLRRRSRMNGALSDPFGYDRMHFCYILDLMEKRATTTANRIPTIADLRNAILAVTRKHGAQNVRVFGSFVRNEQTRKSDVDLLVELPARATLIDQARLMGDLERTLNRKVDVLTYNGISRFLRDRILS